MELEFISKKKTTKNTKSTLILMAFCVLLFVQIFNGNPTAAGLRFVLTPVVIALGLLILTIRFVSWKAHYNAPILMAIFAVISTMRSDVVSWSIDATSLMLCVVFYIIATAQIYTADVVRKILRFYCGLVTFIGLWILISFVFNINLSDGRASISFFGIKKDQNYLSAFLTPAFAVIVYTTFFSPRQKLWNAFKAVMLFAAIYLTGSRAALISMLVSFSLIMLKYVGHKGLSLRKIVVIFLTIIVVAIGAIWIQNTTLFERMGNVDEYATNIRLEIWEYAMEGFYRHPILGSGIEAGTYYSQRAVRWYTHSCFVDILVGQGIVGAFLYLCMFLGFLKGNSGNRNFVITYLLACFVPLGFINGYGCITFWMPMTMCQVISSTAREYGYESILPM